MAFRQKASRRAGAEVKATKCFLALKAANAPNEHPHRSRRANQAGVDPASKSLVQNRRARWATQPAHSDPKAQYSIAHQADSAKKFFAFSQYPTEIRRAASTNLRVRQPNPAFDQTAEGVAVHLLQRTSGIMRIFKLHEYDRTVALGAERQAAEARTATEGITKICIGDSEHSRSSLRRPAI